MPYFFQYRKLFVTLLRFDYTAKIGYRSALRHTMNCVFLGGAYLAALVRFSLFIAFRLLARQKGSFSAFIIRLAAGATALSVAVMLLSAAVVTGFQLAIQEKIYSFWGHILVTPFTANPSNLLTEEPLSFDAQLLGRIQSAAPGSEVYPYVLRPAILREGKTLEGIQLKGVGEDYPVARGLELNGAIDFSDTAYSKDILLSQTLANRLQLKKGDGVLLYFVQSGREAPRIRRVTVKGIYHTGLDEVDRNFALCDIRLVQRLSGWEPTAISGYQLNLQKAQDAQRVADVLYNDVLELPLRGYTLAERYPQIFDWLRLQETNVWVLLGIMAAIAIINLATALLILMVDRVRTVAVLQALGMSRRHLIRLFLSLAFGIGLVGCAGGTTLALLLAFIQKTTGFLKLPEETYYMHTVPVYLQWSQILWINGATLLLCLLFMLLPTLYLRRISPTRVLQFR